jgi:hypothetical protein
MKQVVFIVKLSTCRPFNQWIVCPCVRLTGVQDVSKMAVLVYIICLNFYLFFKEYFMFLLLLYCDFIYVFYLHIYHLYMLSYFYFELTSEQWGGGRCYFCMINYHVSSVMFGGDVTPLF